MQTAKIPIPVRYPRQAARDAALPAAAVTDKNMNNSNKVLYDKIASVNYLIRSYDGSAPPYSFEIRNSAEAVKLNKQTAWSALACGGLVFMQSLLKLTFLRKSGYVMAALAVICAICSFISAWYMENKVIAAVEGDIITVKGRSYSYTEITAISKSALNNLKLMSNVRNVLSVNKSCDGCGDLIRWAKQHNIPINDDSDASAKTVGQKQAALTVICFASAIALAILIYYFKKM